MNTAISPDFYNKLLSKRKNWLPIKPAVLSTYNLDATRTLQKALSISALELPVASWIKDELVKTHGLHSEIVKVLELNRTDEVRHDEALNNLKAVFPMVEDDAVMMEDMLKRANKLADLYSPITLTGVLESSIFFVVLPMLRFLGSQEMRMTANDISQDENVHVSAHVQLSKDLGYRRGKALDSFRRDVIDWLVADLPSTHENKYLSADFWQKTSLNLYTTGKTDTMNETKRAVMPAFFESRSDSLPIYS